MDYLHLVWIKKFWTWRTRLLDDVSYYWLENWMSWKRLSRSHDEQNLCFLWVFFCHRNMKLCIQDGIGNSKKYIQVQGKRPLHIFTHTTRDNRIFYINAKRTSVAYHKFGKYLVENLDIDFLSSFSKSPDLSYVAIYEEFMLNHFMTIEFYSKISTR